MTPAQLNGDGNDGRELPDWGRVVLLDPHEPPQDVVPIAWPSVHVRVLEPVRDVTLIMKNTNH